MATHVLQPSTDAAVRELAELRGKGFDETIREAVEAQLERERKKAAMLEAIRPIQEKYRNLPRTDPRSDKEISDELSGGL